MNKTIINLAGIIILTVGMMAGAASAQNIDGGGIAPSGFYTGIETDKGTCETSGEKCYGDTFVLNSYGEWDTRHLTIAVNYLNIGNRNGGGFSVTGGSWSLVVFDQNGYAGTLYGKVLEGSIVHFSNQDGEIVSKQVRVNLRSTGGLGIFKGKAGENIPGVYQASTNLPSGETSGNAVFTF